MNTLVFRLQERARIRRQIPTRKSVIDGEPDRIANLLEEAAKKIIELEQRILDYSWATNPDRMGGSYSEDELRDNGGWK